MPLPIVTFCPLLRHLKSVLWFCRCALVIFSCFRSQRDCLSRMFIVLTSVRWAKNCQWATPVGRQSVAPDAAFGRCFGLCANRPTPEFDFMPFAPPRKYLNDYSSPCRFYAPIDWIDFKLNFIFCYWETFLSAPIEAVSTGGTGDRPFFFSSFFSFFLSFLNKQIWSSQNCNAAHLSYCRTVNGASSHK